MDKALKEWIFHQAQLSRRDLGFYYGDCVIGQHLGGGGGGGSGEEGGGVNTRSADGLSIRESMLQRDFGFITDGGRAGGGGGGEGVRF